MYDILKDLESPCIYCLYNNEFETMPSLLGNNVVDLVYQARDLGMTYFLARYQDRVERYKIVDRRKNQPPYLVLLESKKI